MLNSLESSHASISDALTRNDMGMLTHHLALISPSSQRALIEADTYSLYGLASHLGHVPIMLCLIDTYKKTLVDEELVIRGVCTSLFVLFLIMIGKVLYDSIPEYDKKTITDMIGHLKLPIALLAFLNSILPTCYTMKDPISHDSIGADDLFVSTTGQCYSITQLVAFYNHVQSKYWLDPLTNQSFIFEDQLHLYLLIK